MTKEEVVQVIAYCDENKISYKQRLSELGISHGASMTPSVSVLRKRKVIMRASSFSWYREDHSSPIQSSLHGPAEASRKSLHRKRCGEHRAQDTNWHDDADKRQSDRSWVEGDHNSVIHSCLTWNVDFAIGSTASQQTCGRAFIRVRSFAEQDRRRSDEWRRIHLREQAHEQNQAASLWDWRNGHLRKDAWQRYLRDAHRRLSGFLLALKWC